MEIDAPHDTVNHYDILSEVSILRIASKSYHEFGTCAYVECSSGRVVSEEGGEIDTVVLTETTETTKASVYTGEGIINNIYATSAGVVDSNNKETSEHDTLANIIVLETTKSHTLDNAIQDAKDLAKESVLTNIQASCEHNYDNGACIKCGKKASSWLEDIEEMEVADLVTDQNGEYNISSAIDLAVLSKMANNTNEFSATVNLVDSIDMQSKEFEPIASFTGTFNGNGNTISNLNVNVTNVDMCAGMFGILDNANVSNLIISNSSFTKNGSNVGALAGCISSGSLNNVQILKCNIVGSNDYTGGLIGSGYSDITKCSIENCNITGKEQTGGLIGKFQCASGNVGNSTMHIDGNTVLKTTIQTPDICGGLIGQIMGNCNAYTIKNNSIEACLKCVSNKKNLLWNVRDDSTQGEDFLAALNSAVYVDNNITKEYIPQN